MARGGTDPEARLRRIEAAEPAERVETAALAQPFEALDEAFAKAEVAQARLAETGARVADELGLTFKNPGLKGRGAAEKKMARKKYDTPRQMTDLSRAGFIIEDWRGADATLQRLPVFW